MTQASPIEYINKTTYSVSHRSAALVSKNPLLGLLAGELRQQWIILRF